MSPWETDRVRSPQAAVVSGLVRADGTPRGLTGLDAIQRSSLGEIVEGVCRPTVLTIAGVGPHNELPVRILGAVAFLGGWAVRFASQATQQRQDIQKRLDIQKHLDTQQRLSLQRPKPRRPTRY